MSPLPNHKTRIICTIGPASRAPATLERMMRNGMDVARLNLAHGDFDTHSALIAAVRAAAARTGRRVALLADLPGPKLRVGTIAGEVVQLTRGQSVRLVAGAEAQPISARPAAEDGAGPRAEDGAAESPAVPLTLESLPATLKPGDDIFLNDGLIHLRLQGDVGRQEALARVVVGGELRSRDGVSLPGIDLGHIRLHRPRP